MALRRDRKGDAAEWVALPATGRSGPPPTWPLPDPLGAELELWAAEWKRPQALEWERNGQELEVALYVQAVIISRGLKATASDRNVVQRKMTDLGLTIPGLRANRWRILDEAPAAPPARAKASRARSARDRLKVVQGGSSSKARDDDGGRG